MGLCGGLCWWGLEAGFMDYDDPWYDEELEMWEAAERAHQKRRKPKPSEGRK